jgi:hypothetical protein
MSSTSTSTDDTLIISDSDAPSMLTHFTIEEDSQDLDPPESPILFEESRALINDCTQELDQGPPQTPVLNDEARAIAGERQNFC